MINTASGGLSKGHSEPRVRWATSTLFAGCLLFGGAAHLGLSEARAGDVLDIFPDTGVAPVPGQATCSFDYAPSGSTWHEAVKEEQVFLASIKSDTWQLGVGKGGHIYSLRGPYGESIPPQRKESPWNDEVWQTVSSSEDLIVPIQDYQNQFKGAERSEVWNATFPLMYFVHQAGIYTKGAGMDGGSVEAPFYSPCLRKRWDPETRTLELVNWMQQARTPCVWKSKVLIYTAYRDLGDGILEVNKVLHNFGSETLTFHSTPWGGARHSSLPEPIISNRDGSYEDADGVYGWTDIPTRTLVNTGGWMAWAQDRKDEASPAMALVFGTDPNNVSNGRRIDEAIRWGTAGSGEGAKVRDYQVAERMSHAKVGQGESWSIRWYLVSGEYAQVRKAAAKLAGKAGVSRLAFEDTVKQSVWNVDKTISTEGAGDPWIQLQAFPVKGTVPLFLLTDKRNGELVVTADPYALAETEPFPNPLPEGFKNREIYDNRVIFKQYAPHIGYQNLLGYAYANKPVDRNIRRIPAPEGVRLHESTRNLWIEE